MMARLRAVRRLAMKHLVTPGAGAALWCCGLYGLGRRNAGAVALSRVDLRVERLPPTLDGLRILQIGDLHVDAPPGAADKAADLADGLEVDLCLLSGDFLPRYGAGYGPALDCIERIRRSVASRLGFVAILGNYDHPGIVDGIEALGIVVLLDETLVLFDRGEHVSITGTDDPFSQGERSALAALAEPGPGLSIALVHTPDLAAPAAAAGHHVYLCGHTHGGQMCLPSGRPVLTNTRRRRDLARGSWREGAMAGFTTTGVGSSGLPLRYNCPPEIALLTLRRAEGPA